MTPYAVVDLALVAVLATTLLALLSSRKSKPAEYGRDDGQADVQPERLRDLDEPFRRAAENVILYPAIEAPYHPRPAPVAQKPTVLLSARDIRRVNTQRKVRGKPPLNRRGISAAIGSPSGARPQTYDEWLAYLTAFEAFSINHQASPSEFAVGCDGVTIDPNVPYNGHGGEWGGAGASGGWSDTSSPVSDSSSSYSSDNSSPSP
jgi:hypothetical protein